MVVTPTLIVPDEASWTMWGHDPGRLGFAPAAAPEQSRQLLVPDPVPASLVEAVRAAWQRMPAPRSYVSWPRQFSGARASELLAEDGHGGAHEHAGDHGAHPAESADHGHGHGMDEMGHDMMAIVGEPSADGLVMDPIEVALGPLAAGLPGGLVLDLSLDGDVVERCAARATLTMPLGRIARGGYTDPTASTAWAAAIALASETAAGAPASEATARGRIAAIEAERALSHLCWLRAFGYVLGWTQLTELADTAAAALMPLRVRLAPAAAIGAGEQRAELAAALDAVRPAVERVRRPLEGSRRLRSRTRGRAATPRDLIETSDIAGPVARAAGVAGDARTGDSLYEALGFRETTLTAGDAEARTLVRALEASSALELAVGALAEAGSAQPVALDPSTAALAEGPRGPVRAALVDGRLAVGAPGAAGLLDLAGEAVVGLELGSALVSVASFDLSGWAVSE